MENIVIAPQTETLETLRSAVAEAVKSQYGAMREYAEFLCGVLPAEWYRVEHNDKSAEAKPVHAEKKALFVKLKAAEHTNPSTIWARVRQYAQEYVEGKPEATDGDGDGENESVGAKPVRSVDLRLIEELSSLWKFLGRQESLTDKQAQCKTHINSALHAMGIDPATIA